MAEYIEREKLLELYVDGKYDTDDYRVPVPVIIQNIKDIPAADVRPVVRSRWIDTDNYYQRWKCSACGCHTRDAAPNFCPNCGADMREES